jgi:hypothetical protein
MLCLSKCITTAHPWEVSYGALMAGLITPASATSRAADDMSTC